MIQFRINAAVRDMNGWGFTTRTGVYGTDYLMRALVTAIGLGRTVRRTRSTRPR